MKILFVTPRIPVVPLHGDQVRAYHFLKLLGRKHEVTLVTPVLTMSGQEVRRQVSQLVAQWLPVEISRIQQLLSVARAPFSRLPLQTLYFCPRSVERQVMHIVKAYEFDVIHIQLARMAPVVFRTVGLPTVVDLIDSLSLNMYRRAQHEHVFKRWIFQLEARKLIRLERQILNASRRQLISSRVDKTFLGDVDTLHVIPNGIDLKEFTYVEAGQRSPHVVLTGHMSYFPNVDAAYYFASSVFPLVRKQVPDASFFVVGADPPKNLQKKLQKLPGIIVTGRVPRVSDFLSRASVAVAPMRAGSGMQFKLLEAMAVGTPVVASSQAAAPLDAVHGEHLLIADDPATMAEYVVELLTNEALRRRLARNARQLVEEMYTWERAVSMLEEVYSLAIRG